MVLQVGGFPHYGRWAEWNGTFRDNVRQFIKGTDGNWAGAQLGRTLKPALDVEWENGAAVVGFHFRGVQWRQWGEGEVWYCPCTRDAVLFAFPPINNFRVRVLPGYFAAAMMGSPGIYANDQPGEDDWWGNNAGRKWRGNRPPFHSINFVTAHDGFTLSDLVAYNEKHNDANGESNNDGESHNLSWNCGEEGPTTIGSVNVSLPAVRIFVIGLCHFHGACLPAAWTTSVRAICVTLT